jgi:putative PIN family toxin of toxin-antitoxin system
LRIVLDTNVIVSGLLSRRGPPAEIVEMVAAGALVVCFDDRILAEYRDVLARHQFRFDPTEVARLLAQVEGDGEEVIARSVSERLPERFPDPADEPFLEVAVAAGAEFLVTGNLRHFPARLRHGVAVVSPRDFLDALRRS